LIKNSGTINYIKVTDFGLSKLAAPEQDIFDPCGTLSYVAPEVLTKEGYRKEVDVWSTGVVMYLLIRGKLPFDSKEKREVIEKTLEANVDFSESFWNTVSSEAQDLIKRMITRDKKQRITVEESLNHNWFKTQIPRIKDRENSDDSRPQKIPSPKSMSTEFTHGIMNEHKDGDIINPPQFKSDALEEFNKSKARNETDIAMKNKKNP